MEPTALAFPTTELAVYLVGVGIGGSPQHAGKVLHQGPVLRSDNLGNILRCGGHGGNYMVFVLVETQLKQERRPR